MDPSIVSEVTQNDDPTMVSWSRARPPLLRSVVARRAARLRTREGQDVVIFHEISAEVIVAGPSARHRRGHDELAVRFDDEQVDENQDADQDDAEGQRQDERSHAS